MAYVVASALVSVRFEQVAKIFWANGLPPPLAKNSPYAYGRFCEVVASKTQSAGGL